MLTTNSPNKGQGNRRKEEKMYLIIVWHNARAFRLKSTELG